MDTKFIESSIVRH